MKDFTIFQFDNYREFLKQTYEYLKTHDPKFSFRYFSKIAGFKSSSMLKYVMDGKRNLSLEASKKFAEAFNLNKKESDFFVTLVLFNQSVNLEEKQSLALLLLDFAGYQKCHPLSDSQLKYYSLWYFSAVKELVGLSNFKEDPQWISKSMNMAITPSEARRALEELQNLGFILRNAAGKLIATENPIASPNEILKVFTFRHYKEMMMRATDTFKNVAAENHSISSLTLKLPESAIEKAKEAMQRFREEIARLETDVGAPDTVFQLSLALFPLTRPLSADEETASEETVLEETVSEETAAPMVSAETPSTEWPSK